MSKPNYENRVRELNWPERGKRWCVQCRPTNPEDSFDQEWVTISLHKTQAEALKAAGLADPLEGTPPITSAPR